MADVPVPGFRKYLKKKLESLKSECHAITNKYTEAASVVQQVYKVLSDTETLAGCIPPKVGKSSEETLTVNSAEGNRAHFCKSLYGKPFLAPFTACTQ
jgi:hypothetical protein